MATNTTHKRLQDLPRGHRYIKPTTIRVISREHHRQATIHLALTLAKLLLSGRDELRRSSCPLHRLDLEACRRAEDMAMHRRGTLATQLMAVVLQLIADCMHQSDHETLSLGRAR